MNEDTREATMVTVYRTIPLGSSPGDDDQVVEVTRQHPDDTDDVVYELHPHRTELHEAEDGTLTVRWGDVMNRPWQIQA